jgi:hypothetical protein
MTEAVLLASSARAVVLVSALVREIGLRRAMETLLRRRCEKWRSNGDESIAVFASRFR